MLTINISWVIAHDDSTRSVWVHPNPENLLRKGAGNGYPRGLPAESGYKETVDFGEYIGLWKSEKDITLISTNDKGNYSLW